MFTVFGSKILAIKMVLSIIGGLILFLWDFFIIEPEGGFSYTVYYWIGTGLVIIYLKYMLVDFIWKFWYRNKQKQVGR
ncbi:MAG: hypothetical protein R3321_10665 [Nitrososphaeraceae archaeon]|nr:hypothetical protein [Nitrososphaeraceae archaeon]